MPRRAALATMLMLGGLLGGGLLLGGCDGRAEAPDASVRLDAGPPPPPRDAGSDAGARDAGRDAGLDAGMDAAVALDAGLARDGSVGADASADDAAILEGDGSVSLDCVDHVVTTVGASVLTGSTLGAGDDFTSFLCAGESAPDLAVLFTAPASAAYVFDTVGTGFDSVLSLHDADCGNPKERACSDDTGAQSTSTVSFYLAAGQSVLLNVDGFDMEDVGDFVLNVTEVADTCPLADLGMATGTPVVTGATGGTSRDTRTASCTFAGGGLDVSYTWAASAAGDYTFAVVDATFDTVLYLLDGGCGGYEMGCNDDSTLPTEDSTITTRIEAGQTVVIVVDGFTAGDEGSFALNITGPV